MNKKLMMSALRKKYESNIENAQFNINAILESSDKYNYPELNTLYELDRWNWILLKNKYKLENISNIFDDSFIKS